MPDPPSPAGAPPLVGRERELAALRAALAAALTGRGALVLIGGEAGIGKTALAEALLAEATDRGALVLIGRCYDLSETPPYGPWSEALAAPPRGDGLPAPPDLGGERGASQAALFATVRAYLTALAAHRPTVLLLDDLHWADPASLDLLRVAARQRADRAPLIVGTYRTDELTRHHPLAALLPLLVREAHAARLAPRPLDAADLRLLLRGRYALPAADEARLVAYLAERAEGNPFFAGELLRALEEEGSLREGPGGEDRLGDLDAVAVPPLLRQVIDARVDRLGEEARHLLAIAAVVGPLVPLGLWAAVAESPEGALLGVIERATEARLLAELPAEGGYRFVHALIRETLYDGLALPRRRAWHRQAAEALAATPAPDPDAVAYHFGRAGDPRAARWLIMAGDRAARAYAWLTAAARYEAALALPGVADADPARRALLLLTLAQLRRYEDRHRGIGYLDEAERLAEVAGDPSLAAAARFDRGHLRLLADDPRAAAERPAGLAAMAAALPTLEALPPAERARLPALRLQNAGGTERYHRGALIYWLAWVGRLDEALTLAAPMLAHSPEATARGLAGLGLAHYYLGRPEEAEDAIAAAQAAFDAAGQQYEVYYRLADRLMVAHAYALDQPDRWQHLIGTVAEAAQRAAEAGRVNSCEALIHLLVARGAWAEAQQQTGAALPIAAIARRQGQIAAARSALGRYFPQSPTTEPGGHPLLIALECQREAAGLALDTDDLPTARAWMEAHDRWLDWSGAVLGRAEGALTWAACHRAAGDLAQARRQAEAALAHAAEPRQPLALLAAHRALGELLTVATEHGAARTHLDAALALAEACQAPYERALTLLALAELRLATGERHDATATLAEARALLEPLEARPALARADDLAARLAAPPPPVAPVALPFGLTAREAEVLRLVAEGFTDATVAARLFLSPYTIKAHLRSIYGKTGTSSRTAAARLARDHGLT